ncbi:hypothetical protein IM511_02490 [Erythrobacteraceae bacterium E2-1 Yellow Sea]|nr:hypothetical protein [Erythrobacteraceae bacterium E2-1 Yellow Sea]
MRKLFNRLRDLKKDLRGNVLIITALGSASLVGAAGLGVDTVQWFLWKRELQQAADSGALAGAYNLYSGNAWSDDAKAEVNRNFTDTVTFERVVNPPQAGAFTGDTGAIEVLISHTRTLPFSSLFLSSGATIRTRAVATAVAAGQPCVIGLATDGIGIDVFGNASVDLDCPVASNSPEGVSVDVGGTGFLDTNLIMSVGGIDYGSGNIPADAAIVPYGLPVSDPLDDRAMTIPSGSCNHNNFGVTPSQNVTINPGRYCGGMDLKGTVTLNPGVYIIDKGSFKVNSSATVVGDGVTIILTGDTASNVADIQINGSAELDLSAPTAAEAAASPFNNSDWSGVLFYQSKLGDGIQNTINGGADINLDGIIYMPTGELTYNGNAAQSAQCLLMITERVNFGGTNDIANNCNDEIDDALTNAFVIRVVE